MILTDKSILESIENGDILISPFDVKNLGSNSYDVHLSKFLAVYELSKTMYKVDVNGRSLSYLDSKTEHPLKHFEIPEDGYVLLPNQLYLGSTLEYTETHGLVPYLEGKSSTGRLGIDIHATAGKGDIGFCNYWTLELSVKIPVKVYAGMPIGQLTYFRISGECINTYDSKDNAKYNQKNEKPVGSMMFKNKF
jgi:dCTP deaminase